MKILLHVGLPKTGTTALQDSLAANAELLEKNRVLYPFWRKWNSSQLWISWIGDTLREDDLQPWMVPHFGGLAEIRELAATGLRNLKDEIAAKNPEVLVLSSEHIPHRAIARRLNSIRAGLEELSKDIQVILYVREPTSAILSTLQETAKLNDAPYQSGAHWIRSKIEPFEAAFDGRLTVLPYDRGQLVDGDVLADFATRFLKDRVNPAELQSRISNESLSGEAVIIYTRYRTEFLPEKNGMIDKEAAALLSAIREADAALPPRRHIAFRPGIADEIRRASPDFVWLRDRYGVEFAELDYATIDGSVPAAFAGKNATYESLLDIDERRIAALGARLMGKYPPESPLSHRLARLFATPLLTRPTRTFGVSFAGDGALRLELGRNSARLSLSALGRRVRNLFR